MCMRAYCTSVSWFVKVRLDETKEHDVTTAIIWTNRLERREISRVVNL